MNHCVNEVQKSLRALGRKAGSEHDIGITQQELGESIIAFTQAWDAGDLHDTAVQLQQIVWHSIALSELLDLPTHALFLDVRNHHVAGHALHVQSTLENHYENRVLE